MAGYSIGLLALAGGCCGDQRVDEVPGAGLAQIRRDGIVCRCQKIDGGLQVVAGDIGRELRPDPAIGVRVLAENAKRFVHGLEIAQQRVGRRGAQTMLVAEPGGGLLQRCPGRIHEGMCSLGIACPTFGLRDTDLAQDRPGWCKAIHQGARCRHVAGDSKTVGHGEVAVLGRNAPLLLGGEGEGVVGVARGRPQREDVVGDIVEPVRIELRLGETVLRGGTKQRTSPVVLARGRERACRGDLRPEPGAREIGIVDLGDVCACRGWERVAGHVPCRRPQVAQRADAETPDGFRIRLRECADHMGDGAVEVPRGGGKTRIEHVRLVGIAPRFFGLTKCVTPCCQCGRRISSDTADEAGWVLLALHGRFVEALAVCLVDDQETYAQPDSPSRSHR